jgi:dTDP-4-amino-4,6-dideoxygalactose transaminase
MVRMMRGFGGGEGGAEALVAAISMRPCAALLALLARRLAAFDASLFARHVRNGDLVVSRLSPRAVVPGERAAARNYWLFPVVVRDPERVLRALNAAGVDAYRGASQLACVEGAERLAPTAHAIMQQVLYLPVQKNMSPADLIAVTDRLNAFLEAAQAPRPRL